MHEIQAQWQENMLSNQSAWLHDLNASALKKKNLTRTLFERNKTQNSQKSRSSCDLKDIFETQKRDLRKIFTVTDMGDDSIGSSRDMYCYCTELYIICTGWTWKINCILKQETLHNMKLLKKIKYKANCKEVKYKKVFWYFKYT